MKFLGMGGFELVIILIVILLIFGPKNLPKLGKAFGKTVSNLRDGMNEGKKEKGEAEGEGEEAARDAAESAAEAAPAPAELEAARFPWMPGEPLPQLFRPAGCSACSRTGYKGRLALHEVMRVTEDIERHAVAHSSSADIAATAEKQGMVSLRHDGWHKVALGQTSIEEILRVVA